MKKSRQNIIARLKEFRGVIIGLVLLSVTCSAMTSFIFTKPVYEATAQVLVNQNIDSNVWMDKWALKAESLAILTYSDMIKSPIILDQVVEQLDLDESASELNEKITIRFANNSQVFNLTVQDADPVMAAAIANTAATVFIDTLLDLRQGNNVKILSEAKIDGDPLPVDTGAFSKMGLSVFLAAAAGVALKLCITSIDPTVRDEQDIQEMFGTPVIGLIPVIPDDQGKIASHPLK